MTLRAVIWSNKAKQSGWVNAEIANFLANTNETTDRRRSGSASLSWPLTCWTPRSSLMSSCYGPIKAAGCRAEL